MFEEYVPICFTAEKCKEIHGRKKFQKIFYLSKEVGMPIREIFEWNIFGPFSRELASEIDSLCEMGLLSEDSVGMEYVYEITKKGSDFLEGSLPSEDETYSRFAGIVQTLNSYGSQELEKLASIRFLLNEGYDYPYVQALLQYTKKYTPEEIEEGKELLLSLFEKLREL